MRAAIYARFSSDNQRDASIDDQVYNCRARMENEHWALAGTYSDRAISGGTLLRPGYQAMLEQARRGAFDVRAPLRIGELPEDIV